MKYHYLVVIFLCAFNLSSQENTTIDSFKVNLNEVIINSDFKAFKNTPISFQNITNQEIRKKNIGQEPSFLLSETPSITAYSDAGSYNGYSYYRLRGIDQTRINMTLDGVPLNEPEDQGVYFSNYPDFLNSVSQIQIQRGVGTSQNGISSFGGSLQFSSPNLSDSTSSTFGIGYGSFNSYRIYGEHNSGIKNQKAFYIRGSHLHSDGYKNRSSHTSSSAFYSGGAYFKKSYLKLTGFIGHQENELAWIGVPEEKIKLDPKTNENTEREDDQFTQSLTQLQYVHYLGQKSTLKSSVYYNYLEGDYDFDLNNFLGLQSNDELYNYKFRSHFIGVFSNYIYKSKKINWASGVHGNIYTRDHIGSEKTVGNLYSNTGFKNEISVFSKIHYTFNKLVLFGDLQFRTVDFKYDGSVKYNGESWNFINPKLGVSYILNNKTEFYYSIGSMGREPTRNDMFGGWDDLQSDSNQTPLIFIIDPEYVLNHELGVKINTSRMSLSVNLFYMSFDNEIVLNGQFGPNGLALSNNVSRSIRSGLELNTRVKISKRVILVNNTSYNHSQIKENGVEFEPILTPKFITNQEVNFTTGKLEVALMGRYQSSSYLNFSNENALQEYLLINSRIRYQLRKWTFSMFMNNLTNIEYYNNGSVDFDGTKRLFIQAPLNYRLSISFVI